MRLLPAYNYVYVKRQFNRLIKVKHIILFITILIKNNQCARSIFDMLYLPWPDQKVIRDRKNPIEIIGKMQK